MSPDELAVYVTVIVDQVGRGEPRQKRRRRGGERSATG